MPSSAARRKLHELIPIVSLFVTTVPELFQIMENWLAFMISACILMILLFKKIFAASLINASQLPLFCFKQLFVLLILFGFLFFLLFLQIYHFSRNLPLLYWLMSLITTGFCSYFFNALAALLTVLDL